MATAGLADVAPIVVNDVTIPESQVAAEIQHHAAASLAEARAKAARALVVRKVLLQEARRQGLAAAPVAEGDGRMETEDEALIRGLIEDAVKIDEPDESDCRAAFDQEPDRYRSPDLVEAEHILLAVSPADKEAYAAAVETAKGLIAELGRQPDRFAGLAKDCSACSSRESGGRLGQLQRGQTVPEFETFLFSLEAGQLCPVPVKTRFGVHVLRVTHRADGRPLPFESVRGRVAERLRSRRWQAALRRYVDGLVGRASISGVVFPRAS